jgi:hypothetical protein
LDENGIEKDFTSTFAGGLLLTHIDRIEVLSIIIVETIGRVRMLYKISQARAGNIFEPSKFWRSPDWSISMKVPHEGYILDEVLYAGDFNDVNLHLLPNVPRLRIWLSDRVVNKLKKLDIIVDSQYTALFET